MDSHVQYILSQCAQRMGLIKLLQHKGVSFLSILTLYLSRVYCMLSQHGEVSSVLNWLVELMPSSGVLSDLAT